MILYFDNHGLIVHKDKDGGDSCADTCRWLYALHLHGKLVEGHKHLILKFIPLKGTIWRHPTQWSDCADTSRDQQTPLVILLEALSHESAQMYMTLNDIRKRHQERGWRYQNLDWANPEHIGYYNPKSRTRLGDFIMALDSLFRVIGSYNSDAGLYKDINHVLAMIQASIAGHSFWSKVAVKLYRLRRYGVHYAFKTFHAVDNPGIYDLYRPLIDKYLLESPEHLTNK